MQRASEERRVDPAVLANLGATTAAQRANRDRLAAGAACVVTGQQAGLFGGPLYTVYKAAAAVVDARALEAETGTPCVPVFWLQNEDHDFAEIAVCNVLGSDDVVHPIVVADDPARQGVSISQRPLDAAAALDEVARWVPSSGPAMALLRRCYEGGSADQGFRAWLEALFAEEGLLVVDPCAEDLRAAAKTVHLEAWDRAGELGAALASRAEALQAAGFQVQVHVRPSAPLSFVHPRGPSGPRYRVEPAGPGRLRLCGTDREVDVAAVEDGPFTSSALLRPIVQDHLLPTAAIVGGPGEIAYFAQLPPLYEALDVPMPLVVPRARFRVVDAAWARTLRHLGLSADDLAAGRDALLPRVAPEAPGALAEDALRGDLVVPLQDALQSRIDAIVAVDPALERAVARTRRTTEHALERLIAKVQRARAVRDDITVGRLDRVLAALQPGGAPQERVHGWPWFGARYGVREFVRSVVDAVRPFDGALYDLPLEPTP